MKYPPEEFLRDYIALMNACRAAIKVMDKLSADIDRVNALKARLCHE